MRETLGVLRSLVVYWRPGRQAGLKQMYRPFVSGGDLVFDVGAHLGDRTAAFQSLGARVVALEPQPRLRRWLTRMVGHRPGVTIRPEAVGPESGRASLAVSRATPTVSTLAHEWRASIGRENPGFRRVRWDARTEVPVTTLDDLIAEYGCPSFCKIDVEGFEARVLAGLSRPIPALSVEFVQGSLAVARECVHLLSRLGGYRFNAIRGEERTFHLPTWRGADEIVEWLDAGADDVASGDLYARLPGGPTHPRGASPGSPP